VPKQLKGVKPSELDLCDVDVIHIAAVRKAVAALPDEHNVGRAAEVLGLLGNATRLKILFALGARGSEHAGELCVCDLAYVAHASKSMTSQQLRLLRTAGLVHQRRAGKLVYYSLAEGPIVSLLEWAATPSSDATVIQRKKMRSR
jgi:DNA-binding transcriptional ArsR family regulator